MNGRGLTIFLTTHYLEEAQALCRRVGLIDHGKLVCLDSPDAIIGRYGKYVLEYFQDSGTEYRFFNDRDAAAKAADTLNCAFQVREANLEDAFIKLTNRRISDQ
jgi:ABC-2 type transport system ATP-binding protein